MNFDFSSNSFDNRTFYFATNENSLLDPDYRYRFNEPIITISGKKGNRTTYFENSEYFAEITRRPSEYFTKYIAGRLSCSNKFDTQKNCQTFKGEFTLEQIKNYFIEFIKIYLLCPKCDYPETVLEFDINKNVSKHCESCGENSIINPKSNDKIYDFIEKKLK
jgi:translation initiation factor 5